MEAVLRSGAGEPREVDLEARFRAGDRAAFDEIVTRHRREVYAVARRLLEAHEDADEAAQLAFLRAWRGRAGFRGESRLSTWLVRIVLNVSKSMLASRRGELPPAAGEPPAAVAPDPAARLDRSRMRWTLRRAVRGLPARQREVVLLKVYGDRTYREVAEILDLSEGAVKAHLHQAVSNLRRACAKEPRMEKV